MSSPAPYREPPPRRLPREQRLSYIPGLGIGPIASAVLVAFALVVGLERSDRLPSIASCSTAPAEGEPCLVLDASQSVASPLRCEQAMARLDALLEPRGAFVDPVIHARTTVSRLPRRIVPVESATVGIPMRGGGIASGAVAVFEPARHGSASDDAVAKTWPSVAQRDDGSVRAADARRLFAACVLAPSAERDVRTVTVSVFRRDDRRGLLAAALVLATVLVWMIRRRTTIAVDSERGVVEVVEHRWLLRRALQRYPLADIADVRLATAAVGPFAATRLELASFAGQRHPLVDGHSPLTRREQARTAERLRSMLDAARV